MQIKLCPQCKRPFMASKESCPHCPPPFVGNQESWLSLGCLVMTIIPLCVMLLFWLFFFMSFFIR